MSDRYFVEQPISGNRATLSGAEAHHLIHVMRATPGTQVTLFDGGGDEFTATVDRIGRAEVELAISERRRIDRELPFELILGVALPKGDRQRWLVEKAVELGVSCLTPLRTQRGVAQPVDQALVRLRRAVIEASKQCGRNRLMRIDQPQAWPDFIAKNPDSACQLLAHPGTGGRTFAELSHDPAILPEGTKMVQLAIGPEGGFTDDEVSAAVEAGWLVVDLGPRILRIETAAVLLAAVVAQCHR